MDELKVRVENQYKNQYITISNDMIRSREKTTLLESKIEALAMFYMSKDLKRRDKVDSEGNSYKVEYVEVPVKEVSALMPRKFDKYVDGRTYEEIKAAAISMKQKIFIIESPEENKFYLKSLYGDVMYDSGRLFIEFDPSMKKYFLNLTRDFSKLKLPILFSFKKNGGFQLYKLLKSYAFAPNLPEIDMSLSQEDLPTYSVSFSLTDLRMKMGYVDLNQPQLKKEGAKDHPDWKKMENLEQGTHLYKRWSDLYKRVLVPGAEEINELSDIYIADVQKILKGLGGKVDGVTFVIQHNKAYYEKIATGSKVARSDMIILTDEQKEDFIDDLADLIEEKIKPKDLKAIAEAGGYNMKKIKKIYAIAQKSGEIDDLVGWMIVGLKKDYSEPVSKKKKNGFNDFEQRKYDYAELERDAIYNAS